MKNFILFVSFLFSVMISNAQENPVYPNGENVRTPSNKAWGVLFSYGAVNFNGDIKQYDFGTATQEIGDFDELRYAYNVGIRRISYGGVIELSFSKGEMAGLKRYEGNGDDIVHSKSSLYDPYNNFDGNGEKFLNQFVEFNAAYLYPLNQLNTFFTDFDIFIKASAGMSIFTAQKNDLYTDEHIYSYGYEDDVNGEGKNSWSNAPRTSTFAFGVFGEYGISKELNLTFEAIHRISSDDVWDASPINKNDSYYYFGIGVAYDVFDY